MRTRFAAGVGNGNVEERFPGDARGAVVEA
jgi:hypothetical protein